MSCGNLQTGRYKETRRYFDICIYHKRAELAQTNAERCPVHHQIGFINAVRYLLMVTVSPF